MKKSIVLATTLLLLSATLSFAQQVDTAQAAIAKRFINLVMKGQPEAAWNLFDTVHVSTVPKELFISAMTQAKNELSIFDSFDLTMTGVKMVDTLHLNQYTFKAISTSKKVIDEVLIDLVFFPQSKLVAGIQPKQQLKEGTAASSAAKETPLENTFQAVINDTTYTIRGINLVPFENNKALLAIQVQMQLPNDLADPKAWGQQQGVKFAKYLVSHDYIKKATTKAQELKKTLMPEIGVSFYDAAASRGYNVMLTPEEYK